MSSEAENLFGNIAVIRPRSSTEILNSSFGKTENSRYPDNEVENVRTMTMSHADGKLGLRSVFGVVPDRGTQQPIIDAIAERDKTIELLHAQLVMEKKERTVIEGTYNAAVNRLRQAVVSQADLSAAEAAAEAKLVSRELDLTRLQKEWESDREKIIVDLEEALRQRDDALTRSRELEQRLVVTDQKTKERSVKFVQLKDKYHRVKERLRELSEKIKQREDYLATLPTSEELEKAHEEVADLKRQNCLVNDRISKVNVELDNLRQEKAHLETIVTQLEADNVTLKAEIEHLQSELQPVLQLSANRTALSNQPPEMQIGVLQKIISELEKDVEKQKQVANLYNSQLQIQKKSNEDTRLELTSKIDKYENHVRILQGEVESKDREIGRIKSDVRKLQSSNQDHLVTIEELKQRVRNFDSLASGDAGVLHEALVQKLYRSVDKCHRLKTALEHLVKAALPNKEVCTEMANSVDVTELLSTTIPVVVFENDLDTSAKLQALLSHSDVIDSNLDETHDRVIKAVAAVQAEAFPW